MWCPPEKHRKCCNSCASPPSPAPSAGPTRAQSRRRRRRPPSRANRTWSASCHAACRCRCWPPCWPPCSLWPQRRHLDGRLCPSSSRAEGCGVRKGRHGYGKTPAGRPRLQTHPTRANASKSGGLANSGIRAHLCATSSTHSPRSFGTPPSPESRTPNSRLPNRTLWDRAHLATIVFFSLCL